MSRADTRCHEEQISEVSFQPSSISKEAIGVHDTSFQNITKCSVDIRKDVCANVVLHHHVPRYRRAHDHEDLDVNIELSGDTVVPRNRQVRDDGLHCVGTTNY